MERRFAVRRKQLIADARIRPEVYDGLLERLPVFLEPFARCLVRGERYLLSVPSNTRVRESKGWKLDFYLSNAAADTGLAELVRVAKAEHRIEDALKRAKSESGLADYEVRTWIGWHHHQVLSLIATWFLTREARREEKMDASDHRGSDLFADGHALAPGAEPSTPWLGALCH